MGVKNVKKLRKVVVALWMAGSPGRKQLEGMLRYVNEGHPWSVRLITDPKDFTAEVIDRAERDGTDGFLCCVGAGAARRLAASTIPTVLMDFPPPALMRRTTNIALMFNDEEDIGRRGADYFLGFGTFASFAFVPDEENRGWSRLRQKGYIGRLQEAGQKCFSYSLGKGPLADWLRRLPKPAAVMAPADFVAANVLSACAESELAVPRQVAVLSVDNDEIVCSYTNPPLSSVRIDHDQHGYYCSRLLDRMMRARAPLPAEKIFLKAGDIVERESTRPQSVAEAVARQVEVYVAAHAVEGIGVDDVVAKLGISRRLADAYVRQQTGKSIHLLIENRRLRLVLEKLRQTRLSMNAIAKAAGYRPMRLKYVFKARFGMTMTEWRARHAKAGKGERG